MELEENPLDRSLKLVQRMEQTNCETIGRLQMQGENLKRINDGVKNINVSLSYSERMIRGMKSIGGAIANKLSRPVVKLPPVREQTDKAGSTVDLVEPVENEASGNKIDELLRGLQNIKKQAVTMNDELNRHNKLLDELDESVDWTTRRIKKDTRDVTKLI